MKISVIIASCGRPVDLRRCLDALSSQTRPADEVLVVARIEDEPTQEVARSQSGPSVRTILVSEPGLVQARNAGMAEAGGDILAFTDDDAAPHPDWLSRIESHFEANETLGAVGGRDWVHQRNEVVEGAKSDVGRVQWFGRLIGNHHLGAGLARPVEMLKGVNMSYRRSAVGGLKFDVRLRGLAQFRDDTAFGLQVRKAGWTIIYDPKVAVDHFPAPRLDNDQRGQFNAEATRNQSHNDLLTMMDYLPAIRRSVFVAWVFLIGTRDLPGGLGLLTLSSEGDRAAVARTKATLIGRVRGLQTVRNTSLLERAVPCPHGAAKKAKSDAKSGNLDINRGVP